MLSLVGVFEYFEDVVDEGFAFVGWKISGVDCLFVGLEIAGGGFFGQVLVYEPDYGVDLLPGKAVSAAG
jgi:hypothetical protein